VGQDHDVRKRPFPGSHLVDDRAQQVGHQRLGAIGRGADDHRNRVAEAPPELTGGAGRFAERPPFGRLAGEDLASRT
jgi:hypothetical protein